MAAKAAPGSRSCFRQWRGRRKSWRRRPTTPSASPRCSRCATPCRAWPASRRTSERPHLSQGQHRPARPGPPKASRCGFLDRRNDPEAELVDRDRQAGGDRHPDGDGVTEHVAGYGHRPRHDPARPGNPASFEWIDGYTVLGALAGRDPQSVPTAHRQRREAPGEQHQLTDDFRPRGSSSWPRRSTRSIPATSTTPGPRKAPVQAGRSGSA